MCHTDLAKTPVTYIIIEPRGSRGSGIWQDFGRKHVGSYHLIRFVIHGLKYKPRYFRVYIIEMSECFVPSTTSASRNSKTLVVKIVNTVNMFMKWRLVIPGTSFSAIVNRLNNRNIYII